MVLLRNSPDGLEVLLGRRHSRSSFLPDFYVFPGGRLDAPDGRGAWLTLAPGVAAGLAHATRRRPDSFVKAALRETAEETGLTLPTEAAGEIDYIYRAITPTYSTRRFDTRFFSADGAKCLGPLRSNGELEDLAWRPVATAGALRLLDVSVLILEEALRRRRNMTPPGEEPSLRISYVGNAARITNGWRAPGAIAGPSS